MSCSGWAGVVSHYHRANTEHVADEGEFGLRVQLKFVPHEDEYDQGGRSGGGECCRPGGVRIHVCARGVLSFAGAISILSEYARLANRTALNAAKPRNMSRLEYEEKDEFKLTDLIERFSFCSR